MMPSDGLHSEDLDLLDGLLRPVGELVGEATRREATIRLWRGGLPYTVVYWVCDWDRWDYAIADEDGVEVGRCRKEGGVKSPLVSARRLLERLHATGALGPRYDDESRRART